MMQMSACMRSITPHGSGHRKPQLQYSNYTYSIPYAAECCLIRPWSGTQVFVATFRYTYQWQLRFVVNRILDQAPLVEPNSQRNAFLFSLIFLVQRIST